MFNSVVKDAKEIKELIHSSSAEVTTGATLVNQTGQALETIQGNIGVVNDHMQAIAVSAREQATGLGEVNAAVNQMDQMTQQNAAMVEETTAASTALAGEAEKLRQMIARFNLAERRSIPAASGRPENPVGPGRETAGGPIRRTA